LCFTPITCLTLRFFAKILAKEGGENDAIVISGQSQSTERHTESALKCRKKTLNPPKPREQKPGLDFHPLPVFPWLQQSLGRLPLFLSDRNVFQHMLGAQHIEALCEVTSRWPGSGREMPLVGNVSCGPLSLVLFVRCSNIFVIS